MYRLWLSHEQGFNYQVLSVHERNREEVLVEYADEEKGRHTFTTRSDKLTKGTGLMEVLPPDNVATPQEIYEGDIVDARQMFDQMNCSGVTTPKHIGPVIYQDGRWVIRTQLGNDLSYLSVNYYDVPLDNDVMYRQVVGNIYQNPEMMN